HRNWHFECAPHCCPGYGPLDVSRKAERVHSHCDGLSPIAPRKALSTYTKEEFRLRRHNCRQKFRGVPRMQPPYSRKRQEVVVFLSAFGLRPSIIEFAGSLRGAGHLVRTPDLYDGEVHSDRSDAIRKIQELGFDPGPPSSSSTMTRLGPCSLIRLFQLT